MNASWGDFVIDPSRLRSDRPAPKTWKNIPIAEPKRIETWGYRWVAVKTAPQCERSVTAELAGLGYQTYCPLGAKVVVWQDKKRGPKQKLIKQFPVFFSYIFVGLRKGQYISRHVIHNGQMIMARKILAVLGDSMGPLLIPHRAIEDINDRELSRHWDDTNRPSFAPQSAIRIIRGPFKDLPATFDAESSTGRIRALVEMFGTRTMVDLDVTDTVAL